MVIFAMNAIKGKQIKVDKVILGIDPGTTLLGYGVIHCTGKNDIKLVVLGVIDLKKYPDHYIKLKAIYDRVQQLVEEYLPDEVALEAPFFGKMFKACLNWAEPRELPWPQPFRGRCPFSSTLREK